MVDEQERLAEADRALREDALKFKSYQEDVERQAENAQDQLREAREESKVLDEEVQRFEALLAEADEELREVEKEMSPLKQ